MKIEFYRQDLTEANQEEVTALSGDNQNWDVIPFCGIEIKATPVYSQNKYADDLSHCTDAM